MELELSRPVTASKIATMMQAVERYEKTSSSAIAYLAARGLEPETVLNFRLGVVSDPLPGHEPYQGYLAIPYLGTTFEGEEQVWSLRFRCIADHGRDEFGQPVKCKDLGHGKYQSLPGDSLRMFNTSVLQNPQFDIHVCEGELDAVVLTQLGYPAVAAPGAMFWRPKHNKLLAGFQRVFVWADGDNAGNEFAATVMQHLQRAAQVPLPAKSDVNEVYLEGGASAIAELAKGVRWN